MGDGGFWPDRTAQKTNGSAADGQRYRLTNLMVVSIIAPGAVSGAMTSLHDSDVVRYDRDGA
jgi:hypothetical protein